MGGKEPESGAREVIDGGLELVNYFITTLHDLLRDRDNGAHQPLKFTILVTGIFKIDLSKSIAGDIAAGLYQTGDIDTVKRNLRRVITLEIGRIQYFNDQHRVQDFDKKLGELESVHACLSGGRKPVPYPEDKNFVEEFKRRFRDEFKRADSPVAEPVVDPDREASVGETSIGGRAIKIAFVPKPRGMGDAKGIVRTPLGGSIRWRNLVLANGSFVRLQADIDKLGSKIQRTDKFSPRTYMVCGLFMSSDEFVAALDGDRVSSMLPASNKMPISSDDELTTWIKSRIGNGRPNESLVLLVYSRWKMAYVDFKVTEDYCSGCE